MRLKGKGELRIFFFLSENRFIHLSLGGEGGAKGKGGVWIKGK